MSDKPTVNIDDVTAAKRLLRSVNKIGNTNDLDKIEFIKDGEAITPTFDSFAEDQWIHVNCLGLSTFIDMDYGGDDTDEY